MINIPRRIRKYVLMNVLNNIHEMAEENIKGAQEMIFELYCAYEDEIC